MSKLFQLQLNQSIVNCGMSYVFLLDSGEFFIIDGGYFTPGEDERLYDFLCSECDGKPHIKGWLFTHAHQDHIGCFMDFIEKYHDDAIIDKLYYNFQPTKHRYALGDWRKKSNDLATIKQFYKIIEKYKNYFEIHTLKTNEELKIGELDIKVLYTADDLYPKEASFNDYSAVVKIKVKGSEILFLGDIQNEGSKILLDTQIDNLKTKIVQVSHHGFNGASKDLYKAIAPKILLFPTPSDEFEKNKSSEVNSFILNELGIEKCYISGYGSNEFEL